MKTTKILSRQFFERPTLLVARNFLGKYLVRVYRGREIIGKIVETEAYIGPKDRASHGFGGKITKRNLAEFMAGGHIYIYLVYGMYYQLNISTSKEGKPECVLIRTIEPLVKLKTPACPRGRKNQKSKIGSGPGKVCQFFKLDKSFYGEDVTKSKRIWLKEGEKVRRSCIIAAPRIGVDYAGPYWSKIKWRFYIKDNTVVSRI